MSEQGNESTENINENINRREKIFGFVLILIGLFSYVVHKILDYTHATAFNLEIYSVLVLLLSMIFIVFVFIVIYILAYVISILLSKDDNSFLVNLNDKFIIIVTLLKLPLSYIIYTLYLFN